MIPRRRAGNFGVTRLRSGASLFIAAAVCIPTALSGLAPPALSAAVVTADDLARCAAIAGPDVRLACYDALAGRPADRMSPPLTPSATAPGAPAAPAAATTVPPSTPQSAAAQAANFGLGPAQKRTAPEGPTAIQANVATRIQDSQLGRTYLVLDNGQTWALAEAEQDARLRPGDPVSIKRAALGSFLMTTESHHSYHVRRVQ